MNPEISLPLIIDVPFCLKENDKDEFSFFYHLELQNKYFMLEIRNNVRLFSLISLSQHNTGRSSIKARKQDKGHLNWKERNKLSQIAGDNIIYKKS